MGEVASEVGGSVASTRRVGGGSPVARPSSPACPGPKLLGSEKRSTSPLSVRSISVICIVMIIASGSPVLPSSLFADESKNVCLRLTEFHCRPEDIGPATHVRVPLAGWQLRANFRETVRVGGCKEERKGWCCIGAQAQAERVVRSI